MLSNDRQCSCASSKTIIMCIFSEWTKISHAWEWTPAEDFRMLVENTSFLYSCTHCCNLNGKLKKRKQNSSENTRPLSGMKTSSVYCATLSQVLQLLESPLLLKYYRADNVQFITLTVTESLAHHYTWIVIKKWRSFNTKVLWTFILLSCRRHCASAKNETSCILGANCKRSILLTGEAVWSSLQIFLRQSELFQCVRTNCRFSTRFCSSAALKHN